jgi:hypothetical protein
LRQDAASLAGTPAENAQKDEDARWDQEGSMLAAPKNKQIGRVNFETSCMPAAQ